MTIRLPGLPGSLASASLDGGTEPNLICEEAVPQSYWDKVRQMNSKRLRSAADNPLQIGGSIGFPMQLGQQAVRNGFWVIENVVVDMLLGTIFIKKTLKSIYSQQGVVIPSGWGLVASEKPSNEMLKENATECKKIELIKSKCRCHTAM